MTNKKHHPHNQYNLDFKTAINLANEKQAVNSNGSRKVSLFTEGPKLAELGREPMLYLRFILITSLYFIVLTAIHVPHLYFFYTSTTSESNVFNRFSMRNWDQKKSGTINLVLSILEIVTCIVTIAYIRFMHWYIRRANNRGNLLSIGDFAVHIRGLPATEVSNGVTRVVNYFSAFGKIASCAMALDTGNINNLKAKKERCELIINRCNVRINKYRWALIARFKRMYYTIRKRVVERDLHYHLSKQKYKCTGDVFLAYNTELERYKCLHAFNKPFFQRVLTTGGAKFAGKHKLKVEPAMEPEDVIWENLEYSTISKYSRRAVSVLLTIFFMALVIVISAILEVVRGKYFKCDDCGVSDVVKTKDLKNNIAWASYGIYHGFIFIQLLT
jgi:hypothetical protein